jgi:hypothetical protein
VTGESIACASVMAFFSDNSTLLARELAPARAKTAFEVTPGVWNEVPAREVAAVEVAPFEDDVIPKAEVAVVVVVAEPEVDSVLEVEMDIEPPAVAGLLGRGMERFGSGGIDGADPASPADVGEGRE